MRTKPHPHTRTRAHTHTDTHEHRRIYARHIGAPPPAPHLAYTLEHTDAGTYTQTHKFTQADTHIYTAGTPLFKQQ